MEGSFHPVGVTTHRLRAPALVFAVMFASSVPGGRSTVMSMYTVVLEFSSSLGEHHYFYSFIHSFVFWGTLFLPLTMSEVSSLVIVVMFSAAG